MSCSSVQGIGFKSSSSLKSLAIELRVKSRSHTFRSDRGARVRSNQDGRQPEDGPGPAYGVASLYGCSTFPRNYSGKPTRGNNNIELLNRSDEGNTYSTSEGTADGSYLGTKPLT